MAIVYDEATDDYLLALEIINGIFTVIFILEVVIKLIGLGFKGYFRED